MQTQEIRVLVVDDSAVVRSIIAESIAAAPGMKVFGTAGDGRQALEILDSVRPDVVTLDIQMPNMDGLATLDAILARRPIPEPPCSVPCGKRRCPAPTRAGGSSSSRSARPPFR